MILKKSNIASVIIPVYNRKKLISKAVMSVYKQTYRPIECIIIDDGSTDDSVSIIKELQTKLDSIDFTINLIEQENAGAPAARNKGIKNANGEFIQFLDSDDLLYPNKIKDQVSLLQNQKEIDGVYGDWHHGTKKNHVLIEGEKWEDTISQFYGGRVIHTLSFLFRRRIIEKIGPWDETLKRNQEVDFHLRGALAGGVFEYVPKVTGLWREHEGERIVSSSGALSALAFHDKWINEFQRLGIFTKERQKTVAYYLFWHAMELESKNKQKALHYLHKAGKLYPDIPEWSTVKMKILRIFLGQKPSITWWYHKAKS